MTTIRLESDLLSELREAVSDIETDAGSVLAAWIYGSRAIGDARRDSDVDLLVVLDAINSPRRISLTLSSEVNVAANLVSTKSLLQPDRRQNGGFFFTSKILAPRLLIWGNETASKALLAQSLSHIIYPWTQYLVPLSCRSREFCDEQILALVFLFKLLSDVSYGCYVARWLASSHFEQYWTETRAVVADALHLLAASGIVHLNSSGLISFARNDHIESESRSRILVEYLRASFWQFQLQIRNQDEKWLDDFFSKNLSIADKLPPDFLFQTITHFEKIAGISSRIA